jgi:hypothetical protein
VALLHRQVEIDRGENDRLEWDNERLGREANRLWARNGALARAAKRQVAPFSRHRRVAPGRVET